MEQLGLGIVAAGLGMGLAVLAVQSRHAARARRAQRAAFFDDCQQLLSSPRTGQGSSGFPRLAGHLVGEDVDLQAVPDTLTFRKLPALWVLVTLPGPLPLQSTLDLMIRPTGVEPFSHFHLLPDQIAAPPGFPQDCAIRTDDPETLIAESVILPHLRLFDDERVKELVISPKGLRVTFLAEEADRGRYLIFRDAEMAQTPLAPNRVQPLLDALLALKNDIVAQSLEGSA